MKIFKLTPIFETVVLIFIAAGAHAQQSTVGAAAIEKFNVAHGPYLQHLSDTSATLVWVTNRNGIGWVELAPDDSTNFYEQERKKFFDSKDGLKKVSRIHTVTINQLKPGTRYRYRIFSQEVLSHERIEVTYGQMVGTAVFGRMPPSFVTNNPEKKSIAFMMINDIHERNQMMKDLLKDADWKNTDFVLFDGDMVNSTRSEEQVFSSFMDTAVKLFASQTPIYYARGNHETRGEFASQFSNYFPGVNGKLYYLFRQGPVCFIVLDSGEDKPDSDIEYYGITDFDAYRDEQAEWLKKAIHDPLFVNAPFKIAVAHIPPFGGWHGEEEVANKFVPILNEAGIDLMLCAHLHRYIRKDAQTNLFNFPIIVNSNHSVVKVSGNKSGLDITVADSNGVVLDSLKIQK